MFPEDVGSNSTSQKLFCCWCVPFEGISSSPPVSPLLSRKWRPVQAALMGSNLHIFRLQNVWFNLFPHEFIEETFKQIKLQDALTKASQVDEFLFNSSIINLSSIKNDQKAWNNFTLDWDYTR